MNFNGATSMNELDELTFLLGIMFYSRERMYIPFSYSLIESCSNNVVKYTALNMAIELALEAKIYILDVYGVSQLIIRQMNLEYEVREPKLMSYFNRAQVLNKKFKVCEFHHVSRQSKFKAVDALAELATSMDLKKK